MTIEIINSLFIVLLLLVIIKLLMMIIKVLKGDDLEIKSSIEDLVPTDTDTDIVINPDEVDSVGMKIRNGDLILLYNGNQGNKKWSWEKVVIHNNELCSVFEKMMMNVYTSIKDIPSNWLVVVKNRDDYMIFHRDDVNLPK